MREVTLKESDFLEISRDVFEKGTSIRFQAKGFSMRPFIQDGDFITVSPIESSSVRIGDVVFYSTAENNVIVHRVFNKYGKDGNMNLVIKGDASFGFPEKVDIQNVLGKVVAIERKGRERRLDTKPYRIICLFFAGLSPFSRWIYPIGSKVKHKGRELSGFILEKLQSFRIYGLLANKFMNQDIQYQIATPRNASSISQFYRENSTDALKEQLKNPEDSGYWIVAKQKDRIVGGLNLAKFPESDYPYVGWWIFDMKVNWRYRRMGIGEKLTEMAADLGAKHCASEIKLLVFEDAKPANNLYRKAGFHQVSIPELDKQLEEEARENSRRRIILAKHIQS